MSFAIGAEIFKTHISKSLLSFVFQYVKVKPPKWGHRAHTFELNNGSNLMSVYYLKQEKVKVDNDHHLLTQLLHDSCFIRFQSVFYLWASIWFSHSASAHSLMSNSLQLDCLSVHSIMDGIFSRILALSSHITQQLIFFIENLVQRDVERYSNDSVVFSARHHPRYSSSPYTSNYDKGSSSSGPGVCGIKYKVLKEDLLVNSGSEAIERNCNYEVVPSIFQGIISRIQKTLRGSGDDIGWLQCAPGMPPIKDGTARFLELLEGIRYGEHTLPNCYVYLLIPGLFSNHGPLYFVGTKRFFSKMGLACHIAKIHSEASVEHNAWELKHYIEELYWGSGKRLMLLGHSKGGVDAAAALSLYWSDLKGKVAGLALVQSPYGGTPVASDILREGQIADREIRKIMELIICKLIKGDIRALEDLTYEKRKEFILKHKLPEDIPIISFHSEASIAPGVLVTMTHIAHAELPRFRLLKFGNDDSSSIVLPRGQIPVAIPISAAMALCALHLQLRYGEKSDGLVTCRDAEVPGSVVVRPDKKLDHAWMVYSSRRKNPTDPDASEMCAAILTMLVEIWKQKKSIKTV